ncbi:MAG TPA: lactonase family protein [Streptosporangiaceae bacterium]|nr:lactonase family protein [Streptosporangiaceae bacterium]
MTRLLIGGYSGAKGTGSGIAVVDNDEITGVIPTDSPSWIARHPDLDVLYAVAEIDKGHVHAWSLVDGVPDKQLGRGDTGGAEPAHLTVDPSGRFLITANYTGGNISVHRLEGDGSIGERTDLIQHEAHGEGPRQEQAHPHMVQAASGELLVTDLGGDAIYRYRLTPDGKLMQEGVIPAPPGSGPRHLLTIGDRTYVTAELTGQVLAYDANWQLLGAVPASAARGHNQPSELVSDGRYLYVGNRGPDSVAVFTLDGGLPAYVTEVPVGDWPRHIALDGDQLYVANERSHSVMVLTINPETGIPALARTIEVPSPTVVLP